MISGTVNAYSEAVVRLVVQSPRGTELETIIDTGFNGWLTMPPALIEMLDLPFHRRGRALLADGSESFFDTYEAAVVWDGWPRRVPVDAAGTASLMGMALLQGHELTVQVVDSGSVLIEALP